MIYGKTPFSHLAMIPKIQKIIDPSYAIEFPPVETPFLVDVMRACLSRDPKKRPTIPQLMEHPFLKPDQILNQVMNTVPPALVQTIVRHVLRLQSEHNGRPIDEDYIVKSINVLLTKK